MPFTLSHPAAAVPLRRWLGHRGDLVALIIGSMSPDFTYYVPVGIKRTPTHTFAALFWFCLPVGTVAYLVYDQLLKAPCAFLLPAGLRRRLGACAPRRLDTARLVTIPFCVVLGAATHIVWDWFTHANPALPALRIPLFAVLGHPITGHRVLQHVSTLGGAAILCLWLARWYRAAPACGRMAQAPFAEESRGAILASLLAAPLLVALSGGVATAMGAPPGPIEPAFAIAAAIWTFRRAVVAALLALIAYGLIWRRRAAQRALA
jgi:hypothetical protein